MCGIAGIASRERADARERVGRMLGALRHRGPDDAGVEEADAGQITLGVVRLAVLDLSPAGHQPMWLPDRSACIAYNGEVYNFRELRHELERDGYAFRSHSDTEVILTGYRVWGADVCARLNGMFAFAIWDAEQRRLLMARDRLGKKPFYYWLHDGELVFASELKAILTHPNVPRRVNLEALQCYLALGYSPAPHTMFEGIRKLPAAHVATWSAEARTFDIRRYWQPPAPVRQRAPKTALRRQVRAEVEAAVERRLISDVPIGAFLSGGLDSSIVVGVMSRLLDQPVRTFSTSFEVGRRSAKYNVDADAAVNVARHFGTEHTEIRITGDDVLACMREVALALDEPVTSPMFQTYLLAREVRRHGVTVVLSGDGSDEVFGGYGRYQRNRLVDLLSVAPDAVLRGVAAAAPRGGRGAELRRAIEKARMPGLSVDRYLTWWEYVDRRARLSLTSPAAAYVDAPREAVQRLITESGVTSSTDLVAWLDLSLWITEDSNMRMDKLCMASSIEARAPFLDYRVVELGLSIPFARKATWRTGKQLLRDAFADLVPEEVLARPKWGWWSPIYQWVRGPLAPRAAAYLAALPRTGLFTAEVASFGSRTPVPAPIVIWKLMLLALWYDAYVEPIGLGDVA
jgi:asparagine synthase (glutamine-hydrolysing)